MNKTERLSALRREVRALRNRYQKQPITGNPGTLAYTQWTDTRARVVTPRMLVVRAIMDRGYNPYSSNLGWL